MKLTLIDEATLETLPPLLHYDGRPKAEVPVAFKVFDPSGRYTFFATEAYANRVHRWEP